MYLRSLIITVLTLGLGHVYAAPIPKKALSSAIPIQRNLTIGLDLMNEETACGLSPALPSLINGLMQSGESAILTTTTVLEKVCAYSGNIATTLRNYDIYQRGIFILLLHKNPTVNNSDDFNLAAAGLKKASFARFRKKPSNIISSLHMISGLGHAVCRWRLLAAAKRGIEYAGTLVGNASHFIKYPFMFPYRSNEFVDLLSKLIRRREGATWNIYFCGHGGPLHQTCGITEQAFKKFLGVLEHGINTRALIYSTCYGGGKMIDYIFDTKHAYPYLILCSGVSDHLTYDNYYPYFFEHLANINNTTDLQQICAFIQRGSTNTPMNLYQVRLPLSREFIIPNITPKEWHLFGSRRLNQNTNMQELWKSTELLIDAPCIKGTVPIGYSQRIYSALKGDAWHFIERIHTELSRNSLFYTMLQAQRHYEGIQKIFLTEHAVCADGEIHHAMVFLNSPTPSSIMPVMMDVFYMIGTQGYRSAVYPVGSPTVKLTAAQTKNYLALFTHIKQRIMNGQQPSRLMYNKFIRALPAWGLYLGFGLGYGLETTAYACGYRGLPASLRPNSAQLALVADKLLILAEAGITYNLGKRLFYSLRYLDLNDLPFVSHKSERSANTN